MMNESEIIIRHTLSPFLSLSASLSACNGEKEKSSVIDPWNVERGLSNFHLIERGLLKLWKYLKKFEDNDSLAYTIYVNFKFWNN